MPTWFGRDVQLANIDGVIKSSGGRVVDAIFGYGVSVDSSCFRGMPAALLLSTSEGDPHLLEIRPGKEHVTMMFICEPGVKPFRHIPPMDRPNPEMFHVVPYGETVLHT
jgi:hypothetical protein